jgi:hypothetical protein
MAIDTSQLTDYTWAQIKLAAKHAMISAAVGGNTLVIGGRTIGRISIKDAKLLYEMAEEMEEAEETGADTSNGGFALVQYGERV